MPHINAFSLDFDGCFGITNARNFSTFISRHDWFIKYFKKTVKITDESVFFIGSNRQHGSLDLEGDDLNKNGLAFSFIPRLAQYLCSRFDDYLLLDTVDKIPFGKTYQSFIDLAQSTLGIDLREDALPPSLDRLKAKVKEASPYDSDEGKLDLLYAQAHKLANDHPKDQITLHFYDDRSDILGSLHRYLSAHSACLPKNLTLCLNQYCEGIHINEFSLIKGTGKIDRDFRKTVLGMESYYTKHVEKIIKAQKDPITFFKTYEDPFYARVFPDPSNTFLKDRDLYDPPSRPPSSIPQRTRRCCAIS